MDTKKDVRKLRRQDLLELLVDMGRQNDLLQAELDAANQALADRTLKLECSGSMAEAALALNGVFEAADAACTQFLVSVKAACESGVFTSVEDLEGFPQANAEADAADSAAEGTGTLVLSPSESRAQAAALIAAAQEEADRIVSAAQEEADRKVGRAKKRARKIVALARSQAKAIADEAEGKAKKVRK